MTRAKGIDLVRHMQYFLAVAECRSFGRAAQLLGISQPPLSQGVQRLETRLGVRLFERRGGVRLTPDGDALMARARTLVDAARAIVDDSAAHRAAFRLGVVGQLPAGGAARLVRSLADAADGVPPGVLVGSSVDLVSDVAAGRLDAALVIHPVVLDGVHAGSSVLRLPTAVLLPDTDHRAAAGSLSLSELAGARLATAARADNPAAYDLVRDTVTVAGLVLDELPVSDDRGALLAVAGGRCLALTADPSLSVPGCVQVTLREDPLPLRLRLVWPHVGTTIAADPSVQDALANALGASA